MELTLPLAVFGPLANGADVRLLARPEGGELSGEALGAFSRFYYAGWRGSSEREDPYWAFFPLDGVYWGLARSAVIAKRSMGVVFVSWMLLIDEIQLRELQWCTHRLWRGALPDALGLPDPGTHLAPVHLRLPAATQLAGEAIAPADNLAFSIESAWGLDRKVSLPGFPALGGTPEAALAAAQERLGMLAAGHSYVTWAGLEDRDFETLGGSFDLVTLDASAGRSGRTTAGIDEAPSVAWLDRRRRETGIEVPVEVAMDQSDFEEIAATRFKELRGRLLDKRDFAAFAEVARENYANSVATTMLLSLTIDALATAADKAKALDTFVRTALGHVGKHQNVSDARFDIAYQAISHRLLFRLAPNSITALAPVLFGADGGIGLTQPVSGLLANRMLEDNVEDWASVPTITAMLAALPPGEAHAELAEKLLALLGVLHDAPRDRLEAHLRGAMTFGEANARYRRMRAALPAALRQRFESGVYGIWGKRAQSAMRGNEGLEQALEAVLAVFEDRRSEL